ncbi:tlde1 domain-containing protein [Erwinia sp. HDF1-3R]|uniref:tlde1 domain-containing protein n=1 Tax=Erwinia sp. HDF1-3R TaxID=3141543 RepID=UPI0031F4C625
MSWVYDVRKRSFTWNGKYQFSARYAGAEGYKDNPDFECLKDKGPLPRGKYRIGRPIALHPKAGRYVLRLTPYPSNNMCGRTGFLIHGDNGRGTASEGCIVLANKFRRDIVNSGDNELVVL